MKFLIFCKMSSELTITCRLHFRIFPKISFFCPSISDPSFLRDAKFCTSNTRFRAVSCHAEFCKYITQEPCYPTDSNWVSLGLRFCICERLPRKCRFPWSSVHDLSSGDSGMASSWYVCTLYTTRLKMLRVDLSKTGKEKKIRIH